MAAEIFSRKEAQKAQRKKCFVPFAHFGGRFVRVFRVFRG
jgi:hypothetical protein